MKLVFHTPSRNCPMRWLNGEEVVIVETQRRHTVRRIGRHVPTFLVRLAHPALAHQVFGVPWTSTTWLAYPDELFLEP